MVVPDFELICEIMLVAEGFIEARLLARKFITLYQLCKELLSKQVKDIPALTWFGNLLKNSDIVFAKLNSIDCISSVWVNIDHNFSTQNQTAENV